MLAFLRNLNPFRRIESRFGAIVRGFAIAIGALVVIGFGVYMFTTPSHQFVRACSLKNGVMTTSQGDAFKVGSLTIRLRTVYDIERNRWPLGNKDVIKATPAPIGDPTLLQACPE
jgi:hypothetical protein